MTRCVSIERHHWLIPATLSSLPEYPKRAAGSLLILRFCVFLCAFAPLRELLRQLEDFLAKAQRKSQKSN
jgi:hypothetical protein